MPDLPTAHESIYTRLFEEWSDAGQTAPIMVAERPQDPLAAAFNSTGGPWLRLSVNHTTGDQATLGGAGSRRFRRGGQIFVQVFTPAEDDDGIGEANDLAKVVQTIFEGVSFDGVKCYASVPRPLDTDDARWIGVLVEISFTYDETK